MSFLNFGRAFRNAQRAYIAMPEIPIATRDVVRRPAQLLETGVNVSLPQRPLQRTPQARTSSALSSSVSRAGAGAGRGGGAGALVGDEAVADVADGADQRLVLGAELGAQPPDVDVHRPGAAEVVVSPDLLEQLGAGEDPARVLREVLEELELLERQVQRATAEPGGVGGLVDGQVA